MNSFETQTKRTEEEDSWICISVSKTLPHYNIVIDEYSYNPEQTACLATKQYILIGLEKERSRA